MKMISHTRMQFIISHPTFLNIIMHSYFISIIPVRRKSLLCYVLKTNPRYKKNSTLTSSSSSPNKKSDESSGHKRTQNEYMLPNATLKIATSPKSTTNMVRAHFNRSIFSA